MTDVIRLLRGGAGARDAHAAWRQGRPRDAHQMLAGEQPPGQVQVIEGIRQRHRPEKGCRRYDLAQPDNFLEPAQVVPDIRTPTKREIRMSARSQPHWPPFMLTPRQVAGSPRSTLNSWSSLRSAPA